MKTSHILYAPVQARYGSATLTSTMTESKENPRVEVILNCYLFSSNKALLPTARNIHKPGVQEIIAPNHHC